MTSLRLLPGRGCCLYAQQRSSYFLYNIPNGKTVVTWSQLDLTSIPRLRPLSPAMSDTGRILGRFRCQEAETSETLIWVSVPLSQPDARTHARTTAIQFPACVLRWRGCCSSRMETRVCVLIERTWMNGDDGDTRNIIGLSRRVVLCHNQTG